MSPLPLTGPAFTELDLAVPLGNPSNRSALVILAFGGIVCCVSTIVDFDDR